MTLNAERNENCISLAYLIHRKTEPFGAKIGPRLAESFVSDGLASVQNWTFLS